MLTSKVEAYHFHDFSHGRPPPVSDHSVVHTGWSLTRDLSVFTSVSVSSSLFSYLLLPLSCSLCDEEWQNPIRSVRTIHFQDRWGAASLRYRNRVEISVLSCMCEQNPYPAVLVSV